jgi:hypothetical protein
MRECVCGLAGEREMRYRSLIGLIWLTLALPGFGAEVAMSSTSSPGAMKPGKRASDGEIVCERRRVAGSNIPQQVCRTRGQLRKEKEDSDRLIHQIQTSPMLKRPRSP